MNIHICIYKVVPKSMHSKFAQQCKFAPHKACDGGVNKMALFDVHSTHSMIGMLRQSLTRAAHKRTPTPHTGVAVAQWQEKRSCCAMPMATSNTLRTHAHTKLRWR